jgi:hypothetical protein
MQQQQPQQQPQVVVEKKDFVVDLWEEELREAVEAQQREEDAQWKKIADRCALHRAQAACDAAEDAHKEATARLERARAECARLRAVLVVDNDGDCERA